MNAFIFNSPLGPLEICADDINILGVRFCRKRARDVTVSETVAKCHAQLLEYFQRERVKFNLKLKMEGTVFQRKVWMALREIPYGEVVSYSELARSIGLPRAARAVGNANNANPFAILIPCHRVVGRQGDLVGYRGGLTKKIPTSQARGNEIHRHKSL